jgi:protein-tyrosine phosphatase
MPISELSSNFQVAVDQQHRVLPIDGVINFRDLGGYQTQDGGKVRYGRVFRSAQLSGLTSQGVQQATSLGIKSIMDLRFDDEISRYPTVKQAFPLAEIVSWQDLQPVNNADPAAPKPSVGKGSWRESLDSNDPEQVREAMRVNYPQKLYSHRFIYKDMLMRLIQDESPLLFHCAAGKDRTGVAAALILSLVGVSDDLIIQDYMITAETTKGLLESFHGAGAATAEGEQDFHSKLASYPKHVIKPVFDTDPAYISTLISYVNQKYGGFRSYAAHVLNLDEEFFNRLERALLA